MVAVRLGVDDHRGHDLKEMMGCWMEGELANEPSQPLLHLQERSVHSRTTLGSIDSGDHKSWSGDRGLQVKIISTRVFAVRRIDLQQPPRRPTELFRQKRMHRRRMAARREITAPTTSVTIGSTLHRVRLLVKKVRGSSLADSER
jgi:hypothetical protein